MSRTPILFTCVRVILVLLALYTESRLIMSLYAPYIIYIALLTLFLLGMWAGERSGVRRLALRLSIPLDKVFSTFDIDYSQFPAKLRNLPQSKGRLASLTCLCGQENLVHMIGNNNADGKAICTCGRHITVHLRRQYHAQ
jgi:hypothetical protein